jgi:hypothetical protein
MTSCQAVSAIGPDSLQSERYLVHTTESSGLQGGLPGVIQSPLAWTGQQFTDAASFTYCLDKHEVTEVEQALADFLGMLPKEGGGVGIFPIS